MKKELFASMLFMAASGAAIAGIPHMGGPMKHISVTLNASNNLEAHVDTGGDMPLLTNYPGEQYDGAAGVLDGTYYNSQYGWTVSGFWAPPTDSFIWIDQLSATDGLRAYHGGNMMNMGSFDPIFGTDASDSAIMWDGTMLHNWYATDLPGDYQATYRVYLGDINGQATAGFGDTLVTLNWGTVPAPGAMGLIGLAGLTATRRRRSK